VFQLKLDLHIHTTYSGDSLTSVKEAIEWGKKKGLDGVAITDHNSMEASKDITKVVDDFIVIMGEEIDTREGHLVALGIDKKIPSYLPFSETLRLVREANGLAVVPHPFDYLRGGVGPGIVRDFVPDAIEVANSHSLLFNITKSLSTRLARELNITSVGGSDSHLPETIGDSYTVVSCRRRCRDSILVSIKEGRTQVFGSQTSLRYRLKTLSLGLGIFSGGSRQ
jgi:predicted metal-dependent phosphoesterase TrpH